MAPTPTPAGAPDPSRLPRHIGTWNAALLLVTFTIGVGILQSPGVVAAQTGSLWLSYGAWLVGAGVALCGALVMADLSVRTPRSGGSTVFLREAYGPRAAFMFGWTSILLNPVAGAAITLVSVRNLGRLFALNESTQTVIALGWVAAIMILNMTASRLVARIIGGVGVFKISALAAVVIVCFSGPASSSAATTATLAPIDSPWVGFGLAVVATMFAYDGWDGISLVAGEVREPSKTIPRATLLGMGLILLVYLTVNVGFFHAMPLAEVASTPALAATAVGRVIGENAAKWVTAFVACSAASTVFSSLMCNPRVAFALAEEGAFFTSVAKVHPRWRTPVVAIAIYGVMMMAYIASGSGFERLTRYMVLGYLPFYGLVALAAIKARRATAGSGDRSQVRPGYQMPLYPLPVAMMLLYVVCGLASGFAGDLVAACGGLGILAAGLVAYEAFRRRRA
jgi:amino acid transporter